MNILVVCDNFDKGGLETQIHTLYEELNEKANFVFVFGKYKNDWDFGKSRIYSGYEFNENSTVDSFIKTVNDFVKIIKDNKIDVIHVHPFYLSIPMLFASQLTKTPICYTYHGFVSLSFPYNINIQAIFHFSLQEVFSKIFCVYNDISDYLNSEFRNKNCVFMSNPINLEKYKATNTINNGKWAFISRLSSDKVDSIVDIIDNLKELSIDELHLHGTGDMEDYLKEYVKKKRLSNKVIFHGHSSKIEEDIKDKYNGIIGMGRVAEEGIAMKLPVLLCGYGKNCGVIDVNNYEYVKNNNFAPIFMDGVNLDIVKKQVEKLKKEKYISDIYSLLKKDCSSKEIAKKYLLEYKEAPLHLRTNFIKLFKDIEKIDNKEVVLSDSIEVLNLVNRNLKTQSLDMNYNFIVSQAVYIYNNVNNRYNEYENKIRYLEQKIEELNIKVDTKFSNIVINKIRRIIHRK